MVARVVRGGGLALVHCCAFDVCAGLSTSSGSCRRRLRLARAHNFQGEMLPGLDCVRRGG
eukprot:COSAG06_NODE_66212_length_255_cov_0.544872_1_plen_59_part_01